LAQNVLVKTISAMSQITSFKLDSDITDQYEVKAGSGPSTSVTRWKGTKIIDLPDKQMQMSMTIDHGDSTNDFGRSTINMYSSSGNVYEQAWIPGAGNTGGIWNKAKLPDELWNSESQVNQVNGLLRSAQQAISLSSETLNNMNYYVLYITPSPEAIADWVISQQQDRGPSLTLSMGGPSLVGRDMFTKTFKGGIFQFWIDSGTYLISKADFTPYFAAAPADLGINMEMTAAFKGQMTFSEYNQPVSIQIPPDALNVQDKSTSAIAFK
jgi:hypothetical protein